MRGFLTKTSGVTVVVSEAEKPPDLSSTGIDLRPGTANFVTLKKQFIRRIPAPYPSKCVNQYPVILSVNNAC